MFTSKFFTQLGFEKNDKNRYEKKIIEQRMQINNELHGLEAKLEFEVFDEDKELGYYIEFRRNGLLAMTGYWRDEEDFRSTFYN